MSFMLFFYEKQICTKLLKLSIKHHLFKCVVNRCGHKVLYYFRFYIVHRKSRCCFEISCMFGIVSKTKLFCFWNTQNRHPLTLSSLLERVAFLGKYINLKGHCHAIWQLYKKLKGTFTSIEFPN